MASAVMNDDPWGMLDFMAGNIFFMDFKKNMASIIDNTGRN